MTFFEFLATYFFTHIVVIAGHIILNKAEREPNLRELFESGALHSDKSIRMQLDEMYEDCSGEKIEPVEEDLYELVDIESVKQKLRLKNQRIRREILLEIK